MRIPELLFVYALLGLAVSMALHHRTGERPWLALPLWPLWLPSLLGDATERYDTAPAPVAATPAPRHPAVARLDDVLSAWAPELAPGVAALQAGLDDLATRLHALDAEVARPEHDLPSLRAAAATEGPDREVHRRHLANVEALVALRDRLRDEHATALAHVGELASRVQLARFQGDSVEGVGHQLATLVAAIEGTREVQRLEAPGPRRLRA